MVRLAVKTFLLSLLTPVLVCQAKPPDPTDSYAVWFDGQNDFLRTAKWLSGTPHGFCLEAWVKPAPVNFRTRIGSFLTHRASGHDKVLQYRWQDHEFSFVMLRVPDLPLNLTSERRVSTSGWHHVAAVFDGRSVVFCVDGAEMARTTATVAADWDAAYLDSFIGTDYAGTRVPRGFRGLIDEVRVWSVPRTTEQLRAGMNQALPPDSPGLAAYWNFDEGGGQVARDVTGHGHDAQLGSLPGRDDNDPMWVRSDCPVGELAKAGPAGHSLWLNSRAGKLQCEPLRGLRSAEALTVEAWVRPPVPMTGSWTIESTGTLPADGNFRFSLGKDGRLSGALQGAAPFNLPAVLEPRRGVWQHIAIACDEHEGSVYVNGRSVKKLGGGISRPLREHGLIVAAGAEGNELFSIEMDELRIWSVARTEKQIRDAMNCAIAPTTRGLAGYWRFDEAGGQIAGDVSPFAAHAQLGDSPMPDGSDPLWLVSDAPLTRGASGEPARTVEKGGALELDGTDDYVDMGNAPELRVADAVTVEAWIKPDAVKSEHPILAKTTGEKGQNAFELLILDGHLIFRVNTAAVGCCAEKEWFAAVGETPIEPGFWHHAAGVYDRQQVAVYVDGVLQGSLPFDQPIANIPTSVKLGTDSPVSPKFFHGQIDELRLWNRARSQSEILDNMNRSLRGDQPGLVGYWTFDETVGADASSATCQVVFDHSAHNNHGILGGSLADSPQDPRRVVSEAPIAPATQPKE
ncbi:MAG: hypothetical protein AMJ84_12300 [Acidithiobacillales bacterium SM23_46]|nr:MAG: hypothetical protein AMJ84_12300 [Acidithiobacillales bacterium SM23_46]